MRKRDGRDELFKSLLKVQTDVRIGMLVDRDRRRRMRTEHQAGAFSDVGSGDSLIYLPRDFLQFNALTGFNLELLSH